MNNVKVKNPDGGEAGRSVELPAEVFDRQVNVPVIHQVVTAQLAAARQGTHSTKSRAQVRGGGSKPYRQKGTGRARQGSVRAPQFTGGGIVHGPTPRSYDQRTPKKMKVAALSGALSDRARGGRLHVLSSIVGGDTPSTKSAASALAKVVEARQALVVVDRADEVTWLSLRNLPTAHAISPDQLNTYDVLVADDVVFTETSLSDFVERVGARVVVHEEAKPKPRSQASKGSTTKSPAKSSTSKSSSARSGSSKSGAARSTTKGEEDAE